MYHEPVQRASAADGAEENNGKPANDTPEQEADVPPDSRVPKRDAVYRSPTLGDSVVQIKMVAYEGDRLVIRLKNNQWIGEGELE